MYLLDNDIFNLFVAGNANVLKRVAESQEEVWLSSVAAEEYIIGRMNALNRSRSSRNSLSLPRAHEDFAKALILVQVFPLFIYSEESEAVLRTFSPAIIRIGAQDCRIAAQAMAHDMTVITRNTRDFSAIGAPYADWSA